MKQITPIKIYSLLKYILESEIWKNIHLTINSASTAKQSSGPPQQFLSIIKLSPLEVFRAIQQNFHALRTFDIKHLKEIVTNKIITKLHSFQTLKKNELKLKRLGGGGGWKRDFQTRKKVKYQN